MRINDNKMYIKLNSFSTISGAAKYLNGVKNRKKLDSSAIFDKTLSIYVVNNAPTVIEPDFL